MQTSRKALPLALGLALGFGIVGGTAADTKVSNPQATSLRESLTRGVAPPAAKADTAAGQFRADGVAVTLYNPRIARRNRHDARRHRARLRRVAGRAARRRDCAREPRRHVGRNDADFTVVRLQQQAAGLPVYGSDIAVTVAKDGRILYVASNTINGVVATSRKSQAVDQQQALDRARAYLGVSGFTNLDAQLVAFVDKTGTHTAWKVRGRPNDGPRRLGAADRLGQRRRAARRGQGVLRDRRHGLRVPARPAVADRSSYGSTGFKDSNDADSSQLTAARVRVTLKDLAQSGGRYADGAVRVVHRFRRAARQGVPVQSTPAFEFTRGNLYFEAVNVYYHIDTFLRYVNQTLGIKALPYQYTGGVQYDPHGESGDDNSSYSSSSGRLTFGQGGVDDAEDADVVIHDRPRHPRLGDERRPVATGRAVGRHRRLSRRRVQPRLQPVGPSDAQYHWVTTGTATTSSGAAA